MATGSGEAKPLRTLVEETQKLAQSLDNGDHQNPRIEVSQVVYVIRLACQFVECFGNHFQFATVELLEKADKLEEAARTSNYTVQALIEDDIRENKARNEDSSSRYLFKIKKGMDCLSAFFQQILTTRENSLVIPLASAYIQVFDRFHGFTVQSAVLASRDDLLTKDQLLKLDNEDEEAAKDLMQKFIDSANVINQYFDRLFQSTETGRDLLRMIS